VRNSIPPAAPVSSEAVLSLRVIIHDEYPLFH
jgi:hypothetical protein